MIQFLVDAKVDCTDGPGGRCTGVIVDPVDQRATHLVVRQKKSPHIERLVSIGQVVKTAPNLARLRCTKNDLAMLESFIETHHIRDERPCYGDESDPSFVLRAAERPKQVMYTPVKHERIPSGKLAIRRGARVKTTDGHIGRVLGFLLEPAGGSITHLVLRKGPPWGHKQLTVPVSEIERYGKTRVDLRLDK
jgi:hypothetical protein